MIVWRWDVIAGLCLINGFRSGAELGVSGGRFTSFLCSRIPDLKMIAVDLWQHMPEREIAGAESYAGYDRNLQYENFKSHVEKEFPGRVTIYRQDTVSAAQHVKDESLDFVFIDADHTFNGCKSDIEAWWPKVRHDGMMAGHDFHWPTVKKAVTQKFNPTLFADNVWATVKSSNHRLRT